MGVEDRRAFDSDGRFLMSRQVRNWWLVETSSSVYVDRVDDPVCCLGPVYGV